MGIRVKKASGIIEDLNLDKLRASLIRSGADRMRVEDIIQRIVSEIGLYASTKRIYRLARKYLRQLNHAAGIRYSLKKALFALGPSGYPFERFIGELLKHHGYKVKTGIFLDGRCVKHEVDVFAVKDDEVAVVECKYHNRGGTAADVKIALYVHARMQDLRPVIVSQHPDKVFNGWLMTNTRFTSEAVQYAECAGLRVKSWGYPEHASIEKMIEEKRLYPVTVLSDVRTGLIKRLIKSDIILLRDLSAMDTKTIQSLLSIPAHRAAVLKKQADELCLC